MKTLLVALLDLIACYLIGILFGYALWLCGVPATVSQTVALLTAFFLWR